MRILRPQVREVLSWRQQTCSAHIVHPQAPLRWSTEPSTPRSSSNREGNVKGAPPSVCSCLPHRKKHSGRVWDGRETSGESAIPPPLLGRRPANSGGRRKGTKKENQNSPSTVCRKVGGKWQNGKTVFFSQVGEKNPTRISIFPLPCARLMYYLQAFPLPPPPPLL